ncbi:tyrosine-type recombinase/integrase [Tsuneonella troitsensis]|uniref:tyrosine-type recombinase/integrase n=1 Tax=Tsuneonella troitsensis TaxID=292222 RepID=UPI00070D35F5|nr:tyrosine-type recombinase/integrase [Tsuneonella troitsensis]
MPAAKPRYTYLAKGRYWRFRHKLYGESALPGAPGEARFHSAYAEKLALVERLSARTPPSQGTFAWLINRYLASAEFKALADATQSDYTKTLSLLRQELGDQPFAYTTRAMIKAVRDDYASTPRKANKIGQMVSRLYSWADEEELVDPNFNPTKGLKRLKRKGGEKEIAVWSDEEIDLVLGAAPVHVRTALLLTLYTGQRREDIVSMTWGQYQGSAIRVRQSKTHEPLIIPCHPVLQKHLDGLTRDALLICTNAKGRPLTANGLSGAIRRAVETTEGMPRRRSIHGLRYAAASRMEEGGATVAEIEAVLGHRTFRMALKYASQRVRARAGVGAMGRKRNDA